MIKASDLTHYLLVLLLLTSAITYSQERFAVIGSNYGGSQSVMINPSNIVNSKLYMDINILSLDFSFQNNYLYIPADKYSLGSVIRTIEDNIEYHDETGSWLDINEAGFNESVYKRGANVNLQGVVNVMGPSAMYSFNDQAFSFYSALRTYAHGKDIPYELANFGYYGFNFTPQLGEDYSFSNFGGAAASWLELGFSYARVLHKSYNHHISAGITVKNLTSYAASYFDFKKVDFRIDTDIRALINESEIYMGFAYPRTESGSSTNQIEVVGKGWGFDFGITYQFKERGWENKKNQRHCEQKFEPYVFKLGVSLLDIGSIKVDNLAEVHKFAGIMEWEDINSFDFNSLDKITYELSQRYYADGDASLRDSTFNIGLPTSLSFQTDYKYNEKIYLGTMLILPLKVSEYQLRRPANLAFIPRYETSKFEFSMPISFYDFYEMRFGLAVRYSFLTIGSDKIGSILGWSNFDGMDIYIGVKFNLLKGRCADKYVKVCNN